MNLDSQIYHDDRVQDHFLRPRTQSAPMAGIVRTEQVTCQRNALVSYPLWRITFPFEAPYGIWMWLGAPRMKPISAVHPTLVESVIVCKPKGICRWYPPPRFRNQSLVQPQCLAFSSLHLSEPSTLASTLLIHTWAISNSHLTILSTYFWAKPNPLLPLCLQSRFGLTHRLGRCRKLGGFLTIWHFLWRAQLPSP